MDLIQFIYLLINLRSDLYIQLFLKTNKAVQRI